MFKKGHLQYNTGRTHFKKGQTAWNKKKWIKKICQNCGKEFEVKPCFKNTAKFCSNKCSGFQARKGKKSSKEHKRKQSEAQQGKKGHNWQGGLTSKNRTIRNSLENKLWRLDIFERDNFTCQMPACEKRGGRIEAHHIKTFSKFPELRFVIDNGITLCKECHKKTKGKEEMFEDLFNSIIKITAD